MSYSNISDVLLEFNKDGSNHKSALALSNTSELEIKNLLKQIDTMIHHKKLRWERQKQDLDNRLQLKEQEAFTQKSAIEQKNVEITQLRKLLENMESTTQEIMKKYEKEINGLQGQLNKLKVDYVKMQKKYKRCTRKGGQGEPVEENTQRRINSLSNSTSNELFQISSTTNSSSSSSCLHQINNEPSKKGLSVLNNANTKTVTTHCEIFGNKLSNKPSLVLENEITRLNAQINEHKTKEMEMFYEKEKLNKILEQCKKMNQELLKKIDDLEKSSALNEAYLDELKSDKTNVEFYKNEIRKRDEHIRDLEALDKADNIELQFYKDEVKKYKKQEANSKIQLEKVKVEYENVVKRLENIENENRKFRSRAQSQEQKAKSDELLKKRYEEERARHLDEISQLKNNLHSCTNELNEKNAQIKNLHEQVKCLEELLKAKDDEFTKANQELIMTSAHVEAMKLENQFLRQSLVEKKSDEKDVSEMQKRYNQVLEITEKENKKLKNEIVTLSECIESLKSKSSQGAAAKSQNEFVENRKARILRDEYEKQIESLKKQHELSIKRLNNEIEKLYGEKTALMSELDNFKHSNSANLNFFQPDKLNKNRSAISSVNGADSLSMGQLSQISSSNIEEMKKARHEMASHHFRFEEPNFSKNVSVAQEANFKNLTKFNSDLEISSPAKSSRISIATQLRYEEQRRKKELETMLDNHIEHLRRSSVNDHTNNYNLIK